MSSMVIHFHSSTEYGGIITGLLKPLGACGYLADQRFQIPQRRYRAARGTLKRLILRIEQYLIYPLKLALDLFRCKPVVAVVCTNTFYAPLVATFFHRRVIYLMYDLFPEALVHAGKLQHGSWKERWIHTITQWGLDRCAGTVFLGERLKAYVAAHYRLNQRSWIIPVGADGQLFRELTADLPPSILYCGNLGHMHEVATLVRAWRKGLGGGIDWVFHCGGPRWNELASGAAEAAGRGIDVTLGGGLAEDEWAETLQRHPIGLVSMVPGSEQVVMPSKTYSALCAGQAILAIAPEASDLVDLIKKHDCGWWVEPGDVDGLERVLKGILSNPDELERRRRNARKAGQEKYSTEVLAGKWAEVLGQVCGESSPS